MRAKIDDGIISAAQLIDAAYSDNFFVALSKQFSTEMQIPGLSEKLKNIGQLYLALRRTENSPDMRRGMRKDYLHMAKQADNFLKMLRTAPHDDIAFALYMTALRLKAAIPATKFEELSEHAQAKSGEPYLLELIRLMELLKDSTKEQAEYFRERPGPKINLGLEYLVRRVADLFGERDRKFSIDHHKPVPTGPAVEFVRALVAPLDDVADTEIATAIRAEQNRRRSLAEKV